MQGIGDIARPAAFAVLLAGLAVCALDGTAATRSDPAQAGSWRLRVTPRAGLSIEAALGGARVRAADGAAIAALVHAGLGPNLAPESPLDLQVEDASDGTGLRLITLGGRAADGSLIVMSRAADGSFREESGAPAPELAGAGPPVVRQGRIEDVLYPSSGPGTDVVAARAAALFARTLDLTRDIALGNRVRLVYSPAPRGGAAAPTLLYAEVDGAAGTTSFYWHRPPGGGEGEFVGPDGRPLSHSALLRTPLAKVRVTSAFGMRMHPLLGFERMHDGEDLGAPAGAPVLAAGDGVVEQVEWNGGYGRWIKLKHSVDLETGYAHLSGWAPGLHVGETVRQGQVIGFVGATGLATGPHLHFEVRRGGRPVDPSTVKAYDPPLDPLDMAVFEAERRLVDAALAAESGVADAGGGSPTG